MRISTLGLALAIACSGPSVYARSPVPSINAHSKAIVGIARDSQGKIARSPQALQQFKNANPCPGTGKSYGPCPGYVVDHVVPLKRGGADAPGNMQWQTAQEAKRKDRWE